MHVVYVDEAGCTGILPHSTSPIQPVFAIAGIIISAASVPEITRKFLDLKRRFFPGLHRPGGPLLDGILVEIKGSEIRRKAVGSNLRERTHAIAYADHVVGLLRHFHARIIGRVWVKGVGLPFNGTSIYTSSMQRMCETFDDWLRSANDVGVVIADSRNKHKNTNVSHSVFTQRFAAGNEKLGNLAEMPTFGHSENHAGLQLADFLCSGLLFPMAVDAYCKGHIHSVHVRDGYAKFAGRYGRDLQTMQHRYVTATGKWIGGITVSDAIGARSGSLLFR